VIHILLPNARPAVGLDRLRNAALVTISRKTDASAQSAATNAMKQNRWRNES
jgi:hypothetical protein